MIVFFQPGREELRQADVQRTDVRRRLGPGVTTGDGKPKDRVGLGRDRNRHGVRALLRRARMQDGEACALEQRPPLGGSGAPLPPDVQSHEQAETRNRPIQ